MKVFIDIEYGHAPNAGCRVRRLPAWAGRTRTPASLDTATSKRRRFRPQLEERPFRMTITTRPRPAAPARPVAPDALRLPGAGELGLGRASALPLRREGPEKLTGLAQYADDIVFPGAWYGATIRSSDPHARLHRLRLRRRIRLVAGHRRDRRGHPRRQRGQPHQRRPAHPHPGRRHHPPPGGAARPAGCRRSRDAARSQASHPSAHGAPRARLRPARARPRSSHISRWARATSRPASPRQRSSSKGPTGSATRSSSTSRTRP